MTDVNGDTAISHAINGDHVECVRILLEHGADPNGTAWADLPLLMHAIKAVPDSKTIELVLLLIEYGADVNVKYEDPFATSYSCLTTPLEYAMVACDAVMIKTLVDNGAKKICASVASVSEC